MTFRVADVIEGDQSLTSAEVTVVQPGGPVNYPDEHGVVTTRLLQFPGDPIMFPGTEAVLFLRPDSNEAGAYWSAWPVTSQYRVENGRIAPVEGNPFASEVEGLPCAAFRQAVQRAADSR